MSFTQKLQGALYGTAIGDAMGAPVEGWSPQRIAARFAGHDYTGFLPPTHKGDPSLGKGAGRITDDTLMTEVLVEAYGAARQHLDAYGYSRFILPAVKSRRRWIPELQAEDYLWDRLWFPEKYPWLRLVPANAEPRTAGVGNMVNCGVAMWMMPAGAVNAGAPGQAYQEAVLIGSAHNESFAVEAGAVMAAAAAEALSVDGTLAGVLEAAVTLAQDGTRLAIAAALEGGRGAATVPSFIARVRAAVTPFDQRPDHVADDAPLAPKGLTNVGRPSRTSSIEELPVALAALAFGQGDAARTLQAAVAYGRDCDSIAGMAMALFGGLYGVDALPRTLRTGVDAANRREFGALAAQFEAAIQTILAHDRIVVDRRAASVAPASGVGTACV